MTFPRPQLVALIVSLAAVLASAQSVTVRPRKVVYKRTAKSVPDFKRTFEVRYPVFSGKLKPAVLQKLRSGTDYWRVFKISLAENLKDDHWLSSMDYEVTYNKNNILDIALTIEGIGAYPDGSTKHLVFDLRTGNRLSYTDVFTSARLPELLSKMRAVMKQKEDAAARESEEVREALANYRTTEAEFYPPIERVELKDLGGFSIGDSGVTFFYDYKYAHVVQALEPFDEFFLSYHDLKPFIRTDGLLAQFVR
jgi:hypothetical protein